MGKGDRKRGRPRDPHAIRTTSGRVSRARGVRVDEIEAATFEHGPMQTVLRARRRHMGLDRPDPVSKAEAEALQLRHRGDLLGILRCDGHITPEQEAAGRAYAEAWARYRATNGLPADTPSACAYGAVRGGGADPDPERAVAARRRYHALQAVLRECGDVIRVAVEGVALRDRPASLHLVKLGLAALALHEGGAKQAGA